MAIMHFVYVILLVAIVLSAAFNGRLIHRVLGDKLLRRNALTPLIVSMTAANLVGVFAIMLSVVIIVWIGVTVVTKGYVEMTIYVKASAY